MSDPEPAALLRAIHDAHSQELLRYVLRLTRGDIGLRTDSVPERSSPDEFGPAFDNRILSDALMSLSADNRVAVVRAYYLGHSVADIAAHQQIPEGTVKSRLHYALRALRISLQETGVVC